MIDILEKHKLCIIRKNWAKNLVSKLSEHKVLEFKQPKQLEEISIYEGSVRTILNIGKIQFNISFYFINVNEAEVMINSPLKKGNFKVKTKDISSENLIKIMSDILDLKYSKNKTTENEQT